MMQSHVDQPLTSLDLAIGLTACSPAAKINTGVFQTVFFWVKVHSSPHPKPQMNVEVVPSTP